MLTRLRDAQPLSSWRREALRTNLWLVPTVEVLLAIALFAGTYALDRSAYRRAISFPNWIYGGTADGSRQVLTGLAAAVITVVGLVFSITNWSRSPSAPCHQPSTTHSPPWPASTGWATA